MTGKKKKGQILIDPQRCKGCQLCIVTCPKEEISLAEGFNDKGYHFIVFKDQGECTACAMCGQICPDMAIEVYK